jgi:hypothetical protein
MMKVIAFYLRLFVILEKYTGFWAWGAVRKTNSIVSSSIVIHT